MLFEKNDLYKLEKRKHEKAITAGVLLGFSVLLICVLPIAKLFFSR